MDEIMGNAWFQWAVMGVVAVVWGALVYMLKRQRNADDTRFKEIERKLEDERDRMNQLVRDLPVNYTLRDEFLRVTTAQSTKMDKITDMLSAIHADVARLNGKMGGTNHDQ